MAQLRTIRIDGEVIEDGATGMLDRAVERAAKTRAPVELALTLDTGADRHEEGSVEALLGALRRHGFDPFRADVGGRRMISVVLDRYGAVEAVRIDMLIDPAAAQVDALIDVDAGR